MKLVFALILAFSLPAFAAERPTAKIVKEKTRYGEISYPVLSGLADKSIENSINRIIKEDVAGWNCDFDGVPKNAGAMDFNAWTDVHLVNENVLSYTVGKDYFCGGAHPNQQTDAHNYDLTTGAPIYIDHMFTHELGGEKLTAFLLKDHKFDEEGCESAYENINWDFYLTETQMVFLPRVSNHSKTCWEEFPVDQKKLQPYFPQEDMEEGRN